MDTAIVTGAGGFIGRWLVHTLLQRGKQVIAIVRPASDSLRWISGHQNLKVLECDLDNYTNLPYLLKRQPGSIFYHLAWAGVSSEDRGDFTIQMNNVKAAVLALEAAAASGSTCFIGVGSIMEAESLIAAKSDGIMPSAGYTYGAMKYLAHLQTKIKATQCNIDHIWAVLANVYGKYDYSSRFINTTLKKILCKEPLEFTSGTQLYDFIYIEDAIRALIAIGESGKAFHRYVIGSGNPATLRQFVETVGRTLSPNQELLFGKIPYSGVQVSAEDLSTRSLQRDTGFSASVSFEKGIHITMEWLRKELTL